MIISSLLNIAILLFIITTIMGMYLSSCVFLEKERPRIIIIIHGIFSIIAFFILISHYPETLIAILLYLIALLFGLSLLYQDLSMIPFTKWFCIAHAIFAVASCVLLIRYGIRMN